MKVAVITSSLLLFFTAARGDGTFPPPTYCPFGSPKTYIDLQPHGQPTGPPREHDRQYSADGFGEEFVPTLSPSLPPSPGPSSGPTAGPSSGPTGGPTSGPTSGPSAGPTSGPTSGPTLTPTLGPSRVPSTSPSVYPTQDPTLALCEPSIFAGQCDTSGDIETDCGYLYPGTGARLCNANGVCICDDLEACGCSKAPPSSCPAFDIDFNDAVKGEYVRDKWATTHGVVITAVADSDCTNGMGYTPNGAARVFDTADPGTNNDNGDKDLGSPNKACEGFAGYDMGPQTTGGPKGYPGVGKMGKPRPQDVHDVSNCVPQGKSLIIQEHDKEYPDDASCGGTITFDFFHTPAYVGEVGLLDVDNDESVQLTAVLDDGTSVDMVVPGYGENAMVRRPVHLANVHQFVVYFTGSGTITFLTDVICPEGGAFPEPSITIGN